MTIGSKHDGHSLTKDLRVRFMQGWIYLLIRLLHALQVDRVLLPEVRVSAHRIKDAPHAFLTLAIDLQDVKVALLARAQGHEAAVV